MLEIFHMSVPLRHMRLFSLCFLPLSGRVIEDGLGETGANFIFCSLSLERRRDVHTGRRNRGEEMGDINTERELNFH